MADYGDIAQGDSKEVGLEQDIKAQKENCLRGIKAPGTLCSTWLWGLTQLGAWLEMRTGQPLWTDMLGTDGLCSFSGGLQLCPRTSVHFGYTSKWRRRVYGLQLDKGAALADFNRRPL